ncbi:hypothetical protein [Streptomyces rimosus]|uniref:hypothetical protein n=1 Tax=Streptomyces rimosus TaxID=1927 RepID=UPI0004C162AE|nr:hypothetical protein [Streptomyces rimosus]
MFTSVLASMERRDHKRHRRDGFPVLFVFRAYEPKPGVTAIAPSVVPPGWWRRASDGGYDENPADDIEALAEGIPHHCTGTTNAFGLPSRPASTDGTGVIGCALWARVWTLPEGVVLDEERALRSLRGERTIHDHPQRIGSGLLCAYDRFGCDYQIQRPDKGKPDMACSYSGAAGWHALPDQSDWKVGFALRRLTNALAAGVLPLP